MQRLDRCRKIEVPGLAGAATPPEQVMSAWISHVEWHCHDASRLADFLAALFGWTFVAHGRRYREAAPERGPRVGLLEVARRPEGETQQAFIAVADLERVLLRARELEGIVVQTPVIVPGYGRYARIQAPEGTVLGLFSDQSAT